MRPIPLTVLTLIHEFEGRNGTFEPTRTLDPVGNAEIGYSHKLSGPGDPLWGAALDQAAADHLAMCDLARAADIICTFLGRHLNVLNDNQYAACIDFVYNEGGGNFEHSTFARLILALDLEDAANQLPKWVYAGGVILAGLVRRRAAEVALFHS